MFMQHYHTFMLCQHQFWTVFLYIWVVVLSTHYPGSVAACLLQEDILTSLIELVVGEPESRLVTFSLKEEYAL